MKAPWAGHALATVGMFCLLAFTSAYGQDTDAQAGQESASAPKGQLEARKWYRGTFETGVDFQRSDNDTDLDLNQNLRVRIDPPKHDNLQIRASLWLTEDLDKDESRTSVLRDIDNASRSDVRARLLYLYLDVKDLWGDSVLRVGRQRVAEGLAFNRIDGLYFKKTIPQWQWYLFGGVRASVYDDAYDDPVAGGGFSYRPSYRTRLSINLFYGEENRSRRDVVLRAPIVNILGLAFPRRVKKNFTETAVSLSLWQDVTQNFRLFGRYLWKDGNGDELRLSATGEIPPWEIAYEIAFRTQFNSAGDGVNDLTNFFRILGTFEPFYNVFAAVHRPLTEKFSLSLEAEFNEADNDDPLTANRDFERLGIVLSMEELADGLDASVALERWTVTGGESTWSISGDVTKEWEIFELTGGVDFERYEDRFIRFNSVPGALNQLRIFLFPGVFPGFNPLVQLFDTTVVQTHENVYSLFTRGRWTISETQELTGRLTYEQDDGPDSPYWRFRAEYSIRF